MVLCYSQTRMAVRNVLVCHIKKLDEQHIIWAGLTALPAANRLTLAFHKFEMINHSGKEQDFILSVSSVSLYLNCWL